MRLPKICGGFLNLTQKCNLNCKYCFVVQQPKQMSFQVAKDAAIFYANNAIKEGVEPSITFFGGEPMLKYEEIIKPLVEFIRETYGDYSISITTNGTLLNEEVYKFFKEHQVGMLLSFDGMEKIQNLNRPYHSGKGSYDDVDIQMHLKYYPHGTFRATVDNDNVEYVFENYLWGEKQGFTNCAFIMNTFADWTDEQIRIYKEQLDLIAKHIIENPNAMRFNEFDQMGSQYKLLQNIDEDYFRDRGQNCAACGRCGLGGNRFGSIGSSGNIYSCQEMTENVECDAFIIGNIYTGVDDKKRLEIANSFNTRNVKCEDEEKCKDCKLYQVCDGACTINNYFKFKNVHTMTKAECEIREHYLKKYSEVVNNELL